MLRKCNCNLSKHKNPYQFVKLKSGNKGRINLEFEIYSGNGNITRVNYFKEVIKLCTYDDNVL